MRSLLTVLVLATAAIAQSERYELGARLKQFEAAWDEVPENTARQRALKVLPDVTMQFFSLQFGKAGKTLDEARFALKSETAPSDAVRWATALFPDVQKRVMTDAKGGCKVRIRAFYDPKAKPKGLSISIRLGDGEAVTAAVDKVPFDVEVPRPKLAKVNDRWDGDLVTTIEVDGKVLVERRIGVSIVPDAEFAAKSILADAKALKHPPSLELDSLKLRAERVIAVAKGTVPENDVRLGRDLGEAEELLASLKAKKPYFDLARSGDLWLGVPTGTGDKATSTACRLFVPKKLDAKSPVPLVVAMHGAGGSENLFFEGYGAGHIVKLCEKRGWLLVAPNSGLGFGLSAPVPVGDIVDNLAERYPIDPKRIFIVGHSMGAANTIAAIQVEPKRFAAASALGGGGTIRKPEAFAELPLFIGIGDGDFALKKAQALESALKKAGAKNVVYKEFANVEHLVIVREALDDVFALFDKLAKK